MKGKSTDKLKKRLRDAEEVRDEYIMQRDGIEKSSINLTFASVYATSSLKNFGPPDVHNSYQSMDWALLDPIAGRMGNNEVSEHSYQAI